MRLSYPFVKRIYCCLIQHHKLLGRERGCVYQKLLVSPRGAERKAWLDGLMASLLLMQACFSTRLCWNGL